MQILRNIFWGHLETVTVIHCKTLYEHNITFVQPPTDHSRLGVSRLVFLVSVDHFNHSQNGGSWRNLDGWRLYWWIYSNVVSKVPRQTTMTFTMLVTYLQYKLIYEAQHLAKKL